MIVAPIATSDEAFVVWAIAVLALLAVVAVQLFRVRDEMAESRRLLTDLLDATPAAEGLPASRDAVAEGAEVAQAGLPASRATEVLSSEAQLAGGHQVLREAGAKPDEPWTCRDCGFTSHSRAAARAHRIATGARSLAPDVSSIGVVEETQPPDEEGST